MKLWSVAGPESGSRTQSHVFQVEFISNDCLAIFTCDYILACDFSLWNDEYPPNADHSERDFGRHYGISVARNSLQANERDPGNQGLYLRCHNYSEQPSDDGCALRIR